MPLFLGCSGWGQPLLLSIMSFAAGSQSPGKVPGWLSCSHTLLLQRNWSQERRVWPIELPGEHQHNYPRTIRDEQCPRRKFWMLFNGNGCGQPMGQPQGAWWHTVDSDHLDELPQTGSVTAGRKGSLLMFNLTLTLLRVSLFPAVISLVALGKPLMVFSVHTTNSSPTWN